MYIWNPYRTSDSRREVEDIHGRNDRRRDASGSALKQRIRRRGGSGLFEDMELTRAISGFRRPGAGRDVPNTSDAHVYGANAVPLLS